jgi:hypothetical protein
MTAAWYAVTDHVGSIYDLAGQEVTIARVRMLAEWSDVDVRGSMNITANGRAWCRVFPTGSQVPTRGGIMRVRTGRGAATGGADMLSADEMLERVKAERDAATEALRMVIGERDHLRGEVKRWRERATDCDAPAECMGSEP